MGSLLLYNNYMKLLINIVLFSFAISATAQDSANLIFLELVNSHRAENGLKPVEYSAVLDSATINHVNWMQAANQLSHYQEPLSTGEKYYVGHLTRIAKFDPNWNKTFSHHGVRENIGHILETRADIFPRRTIDRAVYSEMFRLWVASPGHNSALLDPSVNVAAFNLQGRYDEASKEFRIYANCLLAKKL